MNHIDTDFTKLIRDTVDSGETYVGPLCTLEEAEFLLDGDDEDNECFCTRFAEEQMKRALGLNVDLGTQGPARTANVKDNKTKNQEHATFIFSRSETRMRRYDRSHPDYVNLPPRTPEDMNVPVGSINFPAKRAHGLKLDGLNLSDKDNEAEGAMWRSIRVVQALKNLGAEVRSLERFIDVKYGINFTDRIVREVNVAPMGSLSLYMASGNRPPPAVYISPNYMSLYYPDAAPSVDLTEVGYSGAFEGRHRAIGMFVTAARDLLRGKGAPLEFTMNSGQFSAFDPNQLVGQILETTIEPEISMYVESIPGRASYDEFLASRLSLRQKTSLDSATIQKEVEAMAPKPTEIIRLKDVARRQGAIEMGDIKIESATAMWSASSPSHIPSILCAAFHGTTAIESYGACHAFCCGMVALNALIEHSIEVSSCWATWSNLDGIKDVLKVVPISEARKLTGVKELASKMGSGKRPVLVYLVTRTLEMIRFAHMSSLEEAIAWVTKDMTPTVFSSAGRSRYWCGEIPRTNRMMSDHLSRTRKTVPHRYLRHAAGMTRNLMSHYHILNERTLDAVRNTQRAMKWSDAQEDKGHLTGADKKLADRTRVLFAKIRHEWKCHYTAKAKLHTNNARLFNTHQKALALKGECWKDIDLNNIHKVHMTYVYTGDIIEAAVAHGKALAYEFYMVQFKFKGQHRAEVNPLEGTIEDYSNSLKGSENIDNEVLVESMESKLDNKGNSTLKKKVAAICHQLDDAADLWTDCYSIIKKVVEGVYRSSVDLVRGTIVEAVRNDLKVVNDGVAVLPGVVRHPVAPAIPVAKVTPLAVHAMFATPAVNVPGSLPGWAKSFRSYLRMFSSTIKDVDMPLGEACDRIFNSDNFTLATLNSLSEHSKPLNTWVIRYGGLDLDDVTIHLTSGVESHIYSMDKAMNTTRSKDVMS
jgi:hypothetical protein